MARVSGLGNSFLILDVSAKECKCVCTCTGKGLRSGSDLKCTCECECGYVPLPRLYSLATRSNNCKNNSNGTSTSDATAGISSSDNSNPLPLFPPLSTAYISELCLSAGTDGFIAIMPETLLTVNCNSSTINNNNNTKNSNSTSTSTGIADSTYTASPSHSAPMDLSTPASDTYIFRLCNNDGSDAEMCGNAVRCAAAYLASLRGLSSTASSQQQQQQSAQNAPWPWRLDFDTAAGVKQCLIKKPPLSFLSSSHNTETGDVEWEVAVGMGKPSLSSSQYPLSAGPSPVTLRYYTPLSPTHLLTMPSKGVDQCDPQRVPVIATAVLPLPLTVCPLGKAGTPVPPPPLPPYLSKFPFSDAPQFESVGMFFKACIVDTGVPHCVIFFPPAFKNLNNNNNNNNNNLKSDKTYVNEDGSTSGVSTSRGDPYTDFPPHCNAFYYNTDVNANCGNSAAVTPLTWDEATNPYIFPALTSRLSAHPYFPRGCNIEFARLQLTPPSPTVSDGRVYLDVEIQSKVWERGCGETQACGTGGCAVAIAAALNSLLTAPNNNNNNNNSSSSSNDSILSTNVFSPVYHVKFPGGSMSVNWPLSATATLTPINSSSNNNTADIEVPTAAELQLVPDMIKTGPAVIHNSLTVWADMPF